MNLHRSPYLFLIAGLLTLGLAAGCSSTRTIGEELDDGAITTKIKSKLAADPEINPFNIDVDTLDGRVTLRGEVEKNLARTEAERLARATNGVREVRNEIRVVSPAAEDDESISDAWITGKVKTKLAADPQLNPFDIDVDTQDGYVTLSGRVQSAGERAEAEKLARDTKGVLDVDNQLEIESD